MNLLGPELVRDLVSLIQRAEANDTIQVLVFKSAGRDYLISNVDRPDETRCSERGDVHNCWSGTGRRPENDVRGQQFVGWRPARSHGRRRSRPWLGLGLQPGPSTGAKVSPAGR